MQQHLLNHVKNVSLGDNQNNGWFSPMPKGIVFNTITHEVMRVGMVRKETRTLIQSHYN